MFFSFGGRLLDTWDDFYPWEIFGTSFLGAIVFCEKKDCATASLGFDQTILSVLGSSKLLAQPKFYGVPFRWHGCLEGWNPGDPGSETGVFFFGFFGGVFFFSRG